MSRMRLRHWIASPPEVPPFSGNTFYMAPALSGGSDSNNGGILTPVLTFGRAATLMAPGDRCFLRGGTYLYTNYIAGFTGGTSWSATKLFQNAAGESPVIKTQAGAYALLAYLTGANTKYIEFSGATDGGTTCKLKFDWSDGGASRGSCFKVTYDNDPAVNAATFIRFRNVEVTGAGANGVDGQGFLITNGSNGCELIGVKVHDNGNDNFHHGLYLGAQNCVIENSEFYSNGGYGVHLFAQNQTYVDNNIIRYTKAYNNGKSGFLVASGNDTITHNCVAYGNTENGFIVWTDGVGEQFYFCTSYGNGDYGFYIHNSGISGTVIRNCVVYSNTDGTWVNGGSATTQDHNFNIPTGTTSPQFVNAGAANFHLNSGSPLRDQGITVSGITRDFDGVTMDGTPDIGAFQFV